MAENIPPTIFVVFGATGDLMKKKIVPSLLHLYKKGKLPERFTILGVGRQDLGDEGIKERIREIVGPGEEEFVSRAVYVRGYFEDVACYKDIADRMKLIDDAWGQCSSKLYYLAVPPEFFGPIAKNLAAYGLTKACSDETGWTRVIVEKPFGKDAKTAEELDALLGSLFKEDQIYRIDHYLAKEMLQNILTFRFSNNLFEKSWNRELVESIDITLWESLGVEERGAFYDGVGAFRDVGQNHVLQMLALATMENPQDFSPVAVREKRAEVLRTIRTPSTEEIEQYTFRGQYEGYRSIKGVDQNSNTETYFKVRAFMDHPRWRGVPITFDGGKRLGQMKKEMVVTFRHPSPCLCGTSPDAVHYKNQIVFSLEPKEQILIRFWSKKPGLEWEVEERDFSFVYREAAERKQYIEEYEKLLLDCIRGDQTLFVGTEEIAAMWRFTDPIISAWNENRVPLAMYIPDNADVAGKAAFVGGSAQPTKGRQEIGYIGLGKMGKGMATRLAEAGWKVSAFDRSSEAVASLSHKNVTGKGSVSDVVAALPSPKLVWMMVPAGKPVDDLLEEIVPLLSPGDMLIDGGNSFWKDTVRRAKTASQGGVHYLDVGTSGGPAGARNGACLMIGGPREAYDALAQLWLDTAAPGAFGYMGPAGAGHFVKMVHNGIEYGMMQALAEGFAVMKASPFNLNLQAVAELYNNRSVIESRLVRWLETGFEKYGQELLEMSGSVAHSGEGKWTVETAKEFGIPVPIIEGAFQFRLQSGDNPSYTGKILTALRNQFGGHATK